MKIELHADQYVIRRGSEYFLCFTCDDSSSWISTPHLARHFVTRLQTEEVLAEIRGRTALQAQRRREAKLFLAETL